MRRTPRTEFADSRRAADEARRALLVKVKLREPEPPVAGELWDAAIDPVAPTMAQINAITEHVRHIGISSTYCVEHGGQARTPKPEKQMMGLTPTFTITDEVRNRFVWHHMSQCVIEPSVNSHRIITGVLA